MCVITVQRDGKHALRLPGRWHFSLLDHPQDRFPTLRKSRRVGHPAGEAWSGEVSRAVALEQLPSLPVGRSRAGAGERGMGKDFVRRLRGLSSSAKAPGVSSAVPALRKRREGRGTRQFVVSLKALSKPKSPFSQNRREVGHPSSPFFISTKFVQLDGISTATDATYFHLPLRFTRSFITLVER